MAIEVNLTQTQMGIIGAIGDNDLGKLKEYLVQLQTPVDFFDENGMTPMQHACYKGNIDFVQLILDQVYCFKASYFIL